MAPGQSKAVFVGNIPFNLSEEQIIAILSQAGQVVKFRLMTNPDTGKPKGFGFADYADADSAASAVRNLNDHEVNGRKIRVDWPHNNEKDSVPQNYDQTNLPTDGQASSTNALPPLPSGVDLPSSLKATDAISQTLSTLPPQQLLDVLTQMKSLAISEPARATELLRSAPQLSYAIFQALILMNLVDPKILGQVVEQASRNIAPAPAVQQQAPQQFANYASAPAAGQQIQGMAQRAPQSYATPSLPQQQANAAPPSMSQEEMLRQVLAMDQRTIDTLPPTERAQIMQIRQQMGIR